MRILVNFKKQYKWYQDKFTLFIIFIALVVIVFVIISQINAYGKKLEENKLSPCELGNESWKLDYECIEGTISEYCNEFGCGGGCASKEICREKTQQELAQDYCNKYPNEFNYCKCIEWKDYIFSETEYGGGGYSECTKAIPKENMKLDGLP